jgi:heme/copper-type cytochrome/quinol oxidase subunit 3
MAEPLTRETLPVQGVGPAGTAWWGMMTLIATEGIMFAYLIFCLLYLGAQSAGDWPPGGPPKLTLAFPNTILLIASSASLEWGKRGIPRGQRGRWIGALAVTIVMGAVFVFIQSREWANKSFGIATDSYGSAYFTLTGLHMAHVVAGLIALLFVLVWSLQRRFTPERHEHLSLASLYWHFVDAVWLCVFTAVYLVPRLT